MKLLLACVYIPKQFGEDICIMFALSAQVMLSLLLLRLLAYFRIRYLEYCYISRIVHTHQ